MKSRREVYGGETRQAASVQVPVLFSNPELNNMPLPEKISLMVYT
jgi:hypothetical protein